MVLVLAWAIPQAGRAGTAAVAEVRADTAAMPAATPFPDGKGTMTVGPTSVAAAQTATLTFTYTAATSQILKGGSIELVVPAGWTPPGPGNTAVSCPSLISAAPQCGLTISAMTITVTDVARDVDLGMTVTITYQGQAPGTGGPSTFTASEQSFPNGTLSPLTESPAVAVTCPDGAGSMTVSPSTLTASSTGTLAFTYLAGSCGMEAGGMITLTVPDGWTPPTTASGQGGFTTSAGGGPPTISSPLTITVPVGTLGPDGAVSIDYDLARAPRDPGEYVFDAAEQSGTGGILTALAASPAVRVTVPSGPQGGGLVTVTSPPPSRPAVHRGSTGQMTVRPGRVAASGRSTLTFSYTAPDAGLSPSGTVTVQIPAGWTAPSLRPGQAGYASSSRGRLSVSGRLIIVAGTAMHSGQKLTITYAHATAPSSAGVSTFVTSQRQDGTSGLDALTVSPAVTVALIRPAAPSPVIPVLVIGLVLAAFAAGGLTIRRLRRGNHSAARPSIRAVPHAGPPVTVTVRDTGTRPTLIVRLESRPADLVTTLKETQP
jgi:hypothetical protein